MTAWSAVLYNNFGRPLLLLGLLGGLAVLVVILGCCPVLIPSRVRDVVVGVGLALAYTLLLFD